MTTPSKNNHRPRVSRGPDKDTIKSRQVRSTVIQQNATNSALWVGDVKSKGEALILAGDDLGAKAALVHGLRGQLESAEKELLTAKIEWDERYTVYAGEVELVAVKPEDITKLGMSVLEEQSYTLLPPLAVTVKYDPLAARIRILVRKPPGHFGCRIEISPNPVAPGSFVALKGWGARRAVAGYTSGTWWVRALMFDSDNESEYSLPVSVVVP